MPGTECFYCGALVAKNDVELDHFPVPQHAGGEATVPACRTCHGMKDRFPLKAWPTEWIAGVVADFPHLSRETRLFLAKALALVASQTNV